MALDKFIGKWEEEGKDGFEEFASALNLPAEKRQIYQNAKTQLQYDKNGDTWALTVGIIGGPQGRTYNFTPGQPYAACDIDGSPMTSLINCEGDRFVEKHVFEALQGVEMQITREVSGDVMVVKSDVAGNILVTKYKRA